MSITLGAGVPNYEVAAIDRMDLKATSSSLRDGDKKALSIPLTTSTRPDEPTGLSVSVVDGSPVVTWTAPSVNAGRGTASDPPLPHLPRRRHEPRRPL